MQCPRLDHYVRFDTDGLVSTCGHMVNHPDFSNIDALRNSKWIAATKDKLSNDVWPEECIRCQQTEELTQSSIRLNAISFDKLQRKPDYLIVGGVLDNTCNSACQTCNSSLSTLIGKLSGDNYTIDNSAKFWQLPQDRIVHLDVNGGEPSVSQNYKYLLANIPENVRSIRINTNCGAVIPGLEEIVKRKIKVTITVSLDGIGRVHEYLRWPIAWDKFYSNLMIYKSMPVHLNTWTTVSALNVGNFADILSFVDTHDISHSWSLLNKPDPVNVKYKNTFTEVDVPDVIRPIVAVDRNNQSEIQAYIDLQDSIRKISYKDYLK